MDNFLKPKTLKLRPTEWAQLDEIAAKRGLTRHKLMSDAMRQVLNLHLHLPGDS